MTVVKKKSAARYRRIASKFSKWLALHKDATHQEKFDAFDEICDFEYGKDYFDTFTESIERKRIEV